MNEIRIDEGRRQKLNKKTECIMKFDCLIHSGMRRLANYEIRWAEMGKPDEMKWQSAWQLNKDICGMHFGIQFNFWFSLLIEAKLN